MTWIMNSIHHYGYVELTSHYRNVTSVKRRCQSHCDKNLPRAYHIKTLQLNNRTSEGSALLLHRYDFGDDKNRPQ